MFARPLTVPYPPEIPLQNVQWHCETRMNGSVTSKRTPPPSHCLALEAMVSRETAHLKCIPSSHDY